jgi:uncharacterized membrane protein
MANFATSKLLAGIGSILLLIPGLNIVGTIFTLLGMKGLADHYKDSRIYRNALIGVIFGIIGLITINIGIISVFIIRLSYGLTGGSGSTGAMSINVMPNPLGILVAFIFISLMALFFRKAFHVLSTCSGLRLFRAAGILLFIGAIVPVLCTSLATVIGVIISRINTITYNTQTLLANSAMLLFVLGLFIGLILVYIAFVLLVIAFFSLKQMHPNALTTNTETEYCTHYSTSFSFENSSLFPRRKHHKTE